MIGKLSYMLCLLIANAIWGQSLEPINVCTLAATINGQPGKLIFSLSSVKGVELWCETLDSSNNALKPSIDISEIQIPNSLVEVRQPNSFVESLHIENGILGEIGMKAITSKHVIIDRSNRVAYLNSPERAKVRFGEKIAEFPMFFGTTGDLGIILKNNGKKWGVRLTTLHPGMSLTLPFLRSISSTMPTQQWALDAAIIKHLSDDRNDFIVSIKHNDMYCNILTAWRDDVSWIVMDFNQMTLSLYSKPDRP